MRDYQSRARSLVVALLVLGGCVPRPQGPGIVQRVTEDWQPPPGTVPVPLSMTVGNYDYSLISSASFNGVTMSAAAALDAQRKNYGAALSLIPRQSPAVAGRLRIVVPDHYRMRLLAPPFPQGTQDYQSELRRTALYYAADAVVRSGLFSATDLVEQNDTDSPDPEGADYLLWYRVWAAPANNPLLPAGAMLWQGRWEFKRAGSSGVAFIGLDPGAPPGPAQMLTFINSVRKAVSRPADAQAGSAGDGRAVSSGTGIVVDAMGDVLTNRHVIENCAQLRVELPGGSVAAMAKGEDAARDLALLQTGRHATAWARLRDSATLQPGDPVVVTGFPLGNLVSPEMAVTTGTLTTINGMRGDTAMFEFSAPIQPGNSGGPVLDMTGRVIGISSQTLNGLAVALATGGTVPQNVNFAIKASVVRDFLDAHGIAAEMAPGSASLGAGAVGAVARQFTVKVACWR